MENSKPLVIVLSRNYSTGLGVIRSLGKAGYTVDLIASTKKKGSSIIASCSKYVRESVEIVTPKIQGDTGEGLIEEILQYKNKYKGNIVLFPVDDFTTSIVDRNRDLLKDFFCMPQIVDGYRNSIKEMMDKTIQCELARQAGFYTPLEWKISLKEEVIVPDDVCYPCFVKPLQSVTGHKTEMKVCNDAIELYTHLTKMKQFFCERDVLVQEYLKIDKEFDLSGVCADQNVILPGMIEKTRIAKHELGVTMSGRMVSLDIIEGIKEKILNFLKQIHYIGMFDMELLLCGDKIYFNEINFRSGGPNYFYYLNGVNLPAIFVEEIIGQGHNKSEECIKKYGKTFVYEKVAWEDYIHSYMTKKELKKCIRNADFTLLADEEDHEPGRVFYRRIRLSALKHKMKKKKCKSENLYVDNNRVVVIGRNYCNILTMVRALGEAGYTVDVLKVYKKKVKFWNLLAAMEPEACSKYVSNFEKCIVNDNPENIVNCLRKLKKREDKQLLIPVDDYTACIVDNALEKLDKYYVIPNVRNRQGEISRLMDKQLQKKVAKEVGVPVLESTLIEAVNGEFYIPDSIIYPCFIKPNISMMSTKAKMMKCNNREELENILTDYAKKEDFQILVEQYADIKTEYSILGVSTGTNCIAPGMFKVLEGGHKERKGVTIIGESVDAKEYQDIIDVCIKFIKSLHYVGLFDIDLLETKDGEIYFIELNFRAGASTHLFTKTGLNLPGMLADYMLKDVPIKQQNDFDNKGKKFVSEKVLLEEYVRNDVGLFKVRKYINDSDVCFVKDEKDPEPYNYFKKYYVVAMIMKLPYWIRDRKK